MHCKLHLKTKLFILNIQGNKLDDYLPHYKARIEIDEYDHKDRAAKYEKIRQSMIEDHEITVIKANSVVPNCINRLITQIYMHIIKWTKKQTKESIKKILIDVFKKNF